MKNLSKFAALYIATGLLVANIGLIYLIGHNFQARHAGDKPSYGVSFSAKYARELGVDWQKAYRATVSDLGISNIRLMSYWDEHERRPNRYDFKKLDWMFDEAAKRQVAVSLSIGLRQPRWPECHQPAWTDGLVQDRFDAELMQYLRKVVERYRNHPALFSWQLENEASNQLFGSCAKWNPTLYGDEFDLITELDPNHTLITTASNQIGWPINPPVGKSVGFSIYRHATPRLWGRSFYWSYRYVPAVWHSFRAAAVETLHESSIFIHELQAEPWGDKATQLLSSAEQDRLMNPRILRETVDYALSTGIKEMYLWGAEWWYWQKTARGDDSMWQTAESIFRNN